MRTVTLFHGTTSKYVPDILASGLRPCAKPGNDAHWKNAGRWHSKERGESVYITPERDLAALFAARAAKQYGGDPAVLTIKLPESEWGNCRVDEAGDNLTPLAFLRHVGPIPASEIKGSAIVQPEPGDTLR